MVEALKGGIGIIVQENGTIAPISVAENIYLGELDSFSGRNFFETKKVENFSPLFDVSLKEFDAKVDEIVDKISKTEDKNQIKGIILEAKKGELFDLYMALNQSLVNSNVTKLESEDKPFETI